MNFGFVYVLGNNSMPGLYKLGCTERSPHSRAAELSRATGVPTPFYVLCYAEFEGFQQVEREAHKYLAKDRHAGNREFFTSVSRAAAFLYFHPSALSFARQESSLFGGYEDDLKTNIVLHFINEGEDVDGVGDLIDPWNPERARAPGPAARLKRHMDEMDRKLGPDRAMEFCATGKLDGLPVVGLEQFRG